MNNTTARQRLLEHLLQLDKRKPVEDQLRDKWLVELQHLQYINALKTKKSETSN